MSFEEYQRLVRKSAVYPKVNSLGFIYPAFGLLGKTGEIAEKIKRILRDKNGIVSQEDKELIAQELGDVLWYLAVLATEFDLSLEVIAELNILKLSKKKKEETLTLK